jgi:hypothetical protein
MMTKGRPFYAKYRFVPVDEKDKDTFYNNDKIFQSNPTIGKNRLKKYIANLDIDNTKEYNTAIIKYLSNIFIPSLNKINSVKDIIDKLIMDSIEIKNIQTNLLN